MDILTYLYFEELRVDPKNRTTRTATGSCYRRALCAGAVRHAGGTRLFAPEEMSNLRKIGHFLQGHPDMKRVPGVDMSTGSLGQGVQYGKRYGARGKDR